MKIPEYMRKEVNAINRALNEWDKMGIDNNDVRYARSLISAYHEEFGKQLKQDDKFNTRINLTGEQMQQYVDLIVTVSNMDIFLGDKEEWKPYLKKDFMQKFDKVKGKYGINTLQDYVNFIDRKNRFMDERLLSSVLSYYQYENLITWGVGYGAKSKQEVDDMILKAYSEHGFEGEDLHDFIIKQL